MQTSRLLVGGLAALAIAIVALVALAVALTGSSQAADPGIDDMSIDMDPFSAPANDKGTTGSNGVIGSIETCGRINDNGTLDADEDSIDTLLFDVTAKGIGPSDPMISFGATVNFPDNLVKVVSKDITGQLVGAFPGSAPGDAAGAVPDEATPYSIAGFDTSIDTFESGDGPLARIGIESVTASAGVGDLSLSAAGILGAADHAPTTLGSAKVAVNRACPVPGAGIKGDVDCNEAVDAVDALRVLRFVAGLDPNLPQGCDPIGLALQGGAIPNGNGDIKGDIDCNQAVDAVDALRILRFVAGLDPNLPQGCAPIGE